MLYWIITVSVLVGVIIYKYQNDGWFGGEDVAMCGIFGTLGIVLVGVILSMIICWTANTPHMHSIVSITEYGDEPGIYVYMKDYQNSDIKNTYSYNEVSSIGNIRQTLKSNQVYISRDTESYGTVFITYKLKHDFFLWNWLAPFPMWTTTYSFVIPENPTPEPEYVEEQTEEPENDVSTDENNE